MISNGQKKHPQIFEQMKRTITHKLELTMPDTTQTFYIITNASNTGIGAALLQQHPTERKTKLVSANSKYSICNNTNDEKTKKTYYPVLANIHNIYFANNIDKNEYHPISYKK